MYLLVSVLYKMCLICIAIHIVNVLLLATNCKACAGISTALSKKKHK